MFLLTDGTFAFLPPNRYLFPGGELKSHDPKYCQDSDDDSKADGGSAQAKDGWWDRGTGPENDLELKICSSSRETSNDADRAVVNN